MKKYVFITALALFGGANTLVEASDRIIDFSLVSSGSFVSTPIDTDLDGTSASLTTMKGKSSRLGEMSASILTEAKIKRDADGGTESCDTPEGQPGLLLDLVKARGTYVLRKGNQIFTEAISLSTCININTCFDVDGNVKEGCTFRTFTTGRIIGGTGKYACASGDIQDDVTGYALVVDPRGEFFGSILESRMQGSMNVPENCTN